MWDLIDLGVNNDDSTRSLSTSAIDCLKIFETQTVAKVSSSSKVYDSPKITFTSSQKHVALCIDSQLHVLNDDCTEITLSLVLESFADCLCLSSDFELLIVGENSGTLSIVHICTGNKLWSEAIVTKDNTDDNAFHGIHLLCNDQESAKLCILTAEGVLHVFYGIRLNHLQEYKECDVSAMFSDMERTHTCIVEEHPGFIPTYMYENVNDGLYPIGLGGIGPDAIGMKEGSIICGMSLLNCAVTGIEITKTYSVSGGKYIICLDSQHYLRIICAHTFILIRKWGDGAVHDFVINEVEDSLRFSSIDTRIGVLLRLHTDKLSFQLLEFPSFTCIYSIDVQESTLLIPCEYNQDFIYIVEKQIENLSDSPSIHLQLVMESSFEARLSKLLYRKKFVEAEEFAIFHKLDCQLVHKAKINYLLERLCFPESQNSSFVDTVKEIQTVFIKADNLALMTPCLDICLPSMKQTKHLLETCIKWIQDKPVTEIKKHLMEKISQALNKAVTFETLSNSNWYRLDWQDFLAASMYSHFMQELKSGNLTYATIIWQKHQGELLQSLSIEMIEEILASIPESISTSNLINFLEESFFLPVLNCIPGAEDAVAKWLVQRTYLLEISEKEHWPTNGKRLLEVFVNVCEKLISSEINILYSSYLQHHSLYDQSVDKKSSVGCLVHLIQNLKDLIYLKQEFDCNLALCDYTQENKMSLLYSLLNGISIQYLSKALNTFIKDFVTENSLTYNSCLLLYIKDVIKSSPYSWWHWEEAAWEERLLTVVACIHDCNEWINGVISIACAASVPWSEGVHKLVEKGIALEHSKTEILKTQSRMVSLKMVLKKYDLRDFPVNDESFNRINTVARYILKQDGLLALDDIVNVYRAYENFSDSDAYFTVFCYLLNDNRIEDFRALMTSLQSEISVTCCNKLLKFITMYLDDEFFLENCRKSCSTFAEAGVFLTQQLILIAKSVDEELECSLKSVSKLQREFQKFIPISLLSSKEHCWAIWFEAVQLVMEGTPITSEECERKGFNQKPSIHHIYRLGDVLMLPREEVMTKLVFVYSRHNNYTEAIALCKELSLSFPTQQTAATLIKVARYLCMNYTQLQNLNTISLVETVFHLVSRAVTCCSEENLEHYLPFWKYANLLNSISRLTSQETHLTALNDINYFKWRFHPIYNDEGMSVELAKIHLLFSKCYMENLSLDSMANTGQDMSQLMNGTNELVNSLLHKGQEIGTLQIALYAVNYLPQLVYEQANNDVVNGLKEVIVHVSSTIFQKAIQRHSPDMPFLVNILNMLPQDLFGKFYEKYKKQWQADDHKILTLHSVAIEFFIIHEQIELAVSLGKKWDQLSWFLTHTKSSLSSEETKCLESGDQHTFLKTVISKRNISHEAVASYCTLFNLDYSEMLEHYLTCLLIGPEVKTWNLCTKLPKEDIQILLWKSDCVTEQFTSKRILLELLRKILKQTNPYYYEIIIFILEKMVELYEFFCPDAVETYKKGISLLKFLMMYKRIAAPSAEELQEWSKSHSMDGPVPLVSQTRLPFHALMSQSNVHKIINPELSTSTLSIWLAVSSFLDLSHDQLIVIAIKNSALNYIDHQTSSTNYTRVNSLPDLHLLTPVLNFLRQIVDPKLLLACVTGIVKIMPLGPNKMILAKAASRFAQQHTSAFNSLNIQTNVTAIYQNTAVELILAQCDLATEEYLVNICYPEQLVWQLIENCQLPVKHSVKVCRASEEIAKLSSLNIDEMYFNFLCKCLTPTPKLSKLEESFMVTEDRLAKDLHHNTDGENLERAVSVALGMQHPRFVKLLKSIFEKLRDASYTHKVQALRFMLSAANPQTISEVISIDAGNLRKELDELACVAELESLHLPYSIQMFRNCAKLEVVERVLINLSHNSQALLCCIKICLVYKIWDAQVWLVLLKNMRDLNMKEEMCEIVPLISGNLAHVWHEKAFIHAWEFVISCSLENEGHESENEDSNAETFLLRCPCTSFLDSSLLHKRHD